MKGRESTRKNGNRERKAPSRLKKINKKIHTVWNSEECEKEKRMVLRKMRKDHLDVTDIRIIDRRTSRRSIT